MGKKLKLNQEINFIYLHRWIQSIKFSMKTFKFQMKTNAPSMVELEWQNMPEKFSDTITDVYENQRQNHNNPIQRISSWISNSGRNAGAEEIVRPVPLRSNLRLDR